MIKLQNTRHNRKLLREAGYPFYDPHHTFNRKAWIIVGEAKRKSNQIILLPPF